MVMIRRQQQDHKYQVSVRATVRAIEISRNRNLRNKNITTDR